MGAAQPDGSHTALATIQLRRTRTETSTNQRYVSRTLAYRYGLAWKAKGKRHACATVCTYTLREAANCSCVTKVPYGQRQPSEHRHVDLHRQVVGLFGVAAFVRVMWPLVDEFWLVENLN